MEKITFFTNLISDDSKFSQRMLAKFGWIKGSGIGKNKQVIPTGNIVIMLLFYRQYSKKCNFVYSIVLKPRIDLKQKLFHRIKNDV